MEDPLRLCRPRVAPLDADLLLGREHRGDQRLRVVRIGGAEMQPALELVPGRPVGLSQSELGAGCLGVGAELLIGERELRWRRADHPVTDGQQSRLGEVKQSGQQLALGEVTGRAEEHDDMVVGTLGGQLVHRMHAPNSATTALMSAGWLPAHR